MRGFSPDPYEILGISRDATQREVKQAYRRLAMKFHPDHNPGEPQAEELFKKIQQAYQTLMGRDRPGRSLLKTSYRRPYPPADPQPEHPFFNFFWAVKKETNERKKADER